MAACQNRVEIGALDLQRPSCGGFLLVFNSPGLPSDPLKVENFWWLTWTSQTPKSQKAQESDGWEPPSHLKPVCSSDSIEVQEAESGDLDVECGHVLLCSLTCTLPP